MRCNNNLKQVCLTLAISITLLLGSTAPSNVSASNLEEFVHHGDFYSVEMGDCHLENGEIIRDCRITYRLYGTLAGDRSNVVLMPTWLNGDAEALATYNYVGSNGIVDTDDYFVIAVNALGNGKSSSPSNSDQRPFPHFSIRDQVFLQHRLLIEHFKLDQIHAVVGASMGGYQTYEWLMMFPRFATHFVPIEGSPWYTFYDKLKGRAWEEVLKLPNDSPQAIESKANLLAAIDGLLFWTPDYLNREIPIEDFETWFSAMSRFKTKGLLLDRQAQNRSTANHDIRRGRPDFDGLLKNLGKPSVLAIVFDTDMTVNPKPNKSLAKKIGFEVIEISGDCGHFGSNPECYQQRVIKYVSSFLSRPPKVEMLRREIQIGDED